MAWAVNIESEFGRFFPSGDYPELRDRLHTYFTQEMSAEERATFQIKVSYVRWVFEKFVKEFGVLHPADKAVLTPPQDHEWPRSFQASRTIRSLGSVIQTTNAVLAVSEAMKDLIEGLEPGIHQFRPIALLQPNSEAFPGSYYTMIIGQFRDSFIPDPETEGKLWTRSSYLDREKGRTFTGAYSCHAGGAESFARLSFSSSAIGGAHLWRERNFLGGSFFISDALHDAIKKARLKMPSQFKVKEA
ncbi:MAG: hypothetical protein HC844_02465 [Tabrizicola sp.]|nr:hypothetical protein [Tabrizicola sp.]